MDRFEGKKWALPSKIYSDSLNLYPGIDINAASLMDRLNRLNYYRTASEPRQGEYRLSGEMLDIYLHNFIYPNRPTTGFPLRLYLKNSVIERMENITTKEELFSVEIEPELITAIFEGGWEERNLVKLTGAPKHLTDAIVIIEDIRFYEHFGIDPRSVARAILANLKKPVCRRAEAQSHSSLLKISFFHTKGHSVGRLMRL